MNDEWKTSTEQRTTSNRGITSNPQLTTSNPLRKQILVRWRDWRVYISELIASRWWGWGKGGRFTQNYLNIYLPRRTSGVSLA
jgi:hypothetical protein